MVKLLFLISYRIWYVPWIYLNLKKHVFSKLPELAFITEMILFHLAAWFPEENVIHLNDGLLWLTLLSDPLGGWSEVFRTPNGYTRYVKSVQVWTTRKVTDKYEIYCWIFFKTSSISSRFLQDFFWTNSVPKRIKQPQNEKGLHHVIIFTMIMTQM